MKNLKTRLVLLSLLALCFWSVTYGQLTPSADSYTNTATPTTNYGAKTLLDVESSQTTYIQFDLSAIPTGYTGANITKATLKLYVNAVSKAGSFNVDYVNGAWSEATITSGTAPAIGTTIAASIPLVAADKNQYILIDITPAVQAWLNGSQANDGIALVGNSPLNASFDSKESTTTSHSAELDVVFAGGGGGGGITGITTASGSGLIGGGTSGTLSLSLTNTCTTNQVLQWNGTAWACANTKGSGTITGVTAGTDLTGGGNSGIVTLNLDANKVPLLAAANTFTGNQTVNGNLSATGVVTGSAFQIGSNLFASGSYLAANAFLGFAGNTTSSGLGANTAAGFHALASDTTGYDNTASGANALFTNNAGYYNTASGVDALYSNTSGVYNTATGVNALYFNTTGYDNTANGVQALDSNTIGHDNVASGLDALYSNNAGFYNTASGVQALYNNVNGDENTASGEGALFSNVNGFGNVAIGVQALYYNTVGPNTAVGLQALISNTTGLNNTATGSQSLYDNTTGHDNTAAGNLALSSNNVGFENTASGSESLLSNTSGFENSAYGYQALVNNTSGQGNTAVGVGALSGNTTGTLLTCIGYGCTAGADGLSNATAIGAHAVVSQSNSLVLGGTGEHAVKVGIGTATPSNVLTIAQGLGQPLSDGWQTFSSRRWKTNIQTLHGALAKVEQLRGVSYDLKATGKHEMGVIAEEVGAVVPDVVTWEKNGKDAQSVDYGRLTALLIEATKEQQKEIQQQQAVLRIQAAAIRNLKSELRTTRQTLERVKTQMAGTQPALVAAK
jgi:Chaperone of endosialidase